jgi:threonine dehydratase
MTIVAREVETTWEVPTLADVLRARRQITPYLRPTPLYAYPSLNALTGVSLWVKHENHLPVGAFKVRGGVNLISRMSAEERAHGVIGASTGNHGQSIAYAASLFGVSARICVPQNANPVKVEAMRSMSAEVILHGKDFDEAREHCERLAREHGYRYIHSGNEPMLVAGVGTAYLEIMEDLPEADVIIVPVGGGSGASAACITAKAIRPGIEIIGVQSERAPAAFRSWEAHALLEDRCETFAEGLATRTAFEMPQQILWSLLDRFILVSDDEIRVAMRTMIEKTRNLIEGAGAAPLAAASRLASELQGKRVVIVCSGGNASPAQLREILSTPGA